MGCEMIADILTAGDGCEAADLLANWMAEVFAGKCAACQADAAHKLAVDMLPLVRPDLFNRWEA